MMTKNTISLLRVSIVVMLGIAAAAVYAEPNRTGKVQEQLLCNMPSFIPGSFFNLTKSATINGCRIAWAERHGAKWVVVIDGQSGPEYDGIGDIFFSPDGKHVAYGARRNKWFVSNKWFAVVDGQVGPEYDGIGDIFFSPDGKHVAYGVRRNKWLVNKWFVVVDGQAWPEYDGIACGPIFLKDGKVEYIARKNGSLYRVELTP